MAGNNKVDIGLQEKINNCIGSVNILKNAIAVVRVAGADINEADRIYNACREYEYLDLSPINKRATGAMLSSVAGAVTAGVGTVTSLAANSDKVRSDNTDADIANADCDSLKPFVAKEYQNISNYKSYSGEIKVYNNSLANSEFAECYDLHSSLHYIQTYEDLFDIINNNVARLKQGIVIKQRGISNKIQFTAYAINEMLYTKSSTHGADINQYNDVTADNCTKMFIKSNNNSPDSIQEVFSSGYHRITCVVTNIAGDIQFNATYSFPD